MVHFFVTGTVEVIEDDQFIVLYERYRDSSTAIQRTVTHIINVLLGEMIHVLLGRRIGSAILIEKSSHETKVYCMINAYKDFIEAVCHGNPYYIPHLLQRLGIRKVLTPFRLDKIDPKLVYKTKIKLRHTTLYIHSYNEEIPEPLRI